MKVLVTRRIHVYGMDGIGRRTMPKRVCLEGEKKEQSNNKLTTNEMAGSFTLPSFGGKF